jgi:hypothetical protein
MHHTRGATVSRQAGTRLRSQDPTRAGTAVRGTGNGSVPAARAGRELTMKTAESLPASD